MHNSHLTGTSHPDHHRGLRTVATIEAAKGVLALLLGFAFVEILRREVDLQEAALNLLYWLHIDPDRRMAHALMRLAERASETHVATVVLLVLLYSSLRFLESYGLWRQRIWAEWLAIISGTIYFPFEIRALIRHPTAFHWAILLINIVVVLYVAYVRWEDIQQRRNRAPTGRLVEDGD
jgi:uncharacterized membrane protein (DUF2068 family)